VSHIHVVLDVFRRGHHVLQLVIVRGLLNLHGSQVWVGQVWLWVVFSQAEKNPYLGTGGYRF
jgi:hypothetical protein